MGDAEWRSVMYLDSTYENEFRNVLKIYKKVLQLITIKQNKFKKIAEHIGTPVKIGVQKFIQLEEEITQLESVYFEIEMFRNVFCSQEDKEMIQLMIDELSVPQIAQELSISVRTVYRRVAKIAENFLNFKNKLGGKKCQNQQQNQQQREM